MTVLAVTASLIAALCLGYRLGLRAGRRTPTWRQRTSSVALARQAAGLVTLLAIVRLERSARRRLPWR
ncbi:hypothetical protein C6A87_021340 [Mycobacterium sp. ITM-2016-00317]|uniref:hypothetical protein n=1 Tax=Mycobacterium sp. ITM-2016-00317 TaxID=2099694 RepID=UPI000D403517|nr:hypothetical protein [Mycobacterium sp. ITM-2016-00317]WNG86378.1 hypothetical protein C6A87_021340 [Mycobacterium sp. ITM-2016-00317]